MPRYEVEALIHRSQAVTLEVEADSVDEARSIVESMTDSLSDVPECTWAGEDEWTEDVVTEVNQISDDEPDIRGEDD